MANKSNPMYQQVAKSSKPYWAMANEFEDGQEAPANF